MDGNVVDDSNDNNMKEMPICGDCSDPSQSIQINEDEHEQEQQVPPIERLIIPSDVIEINENDEFIIIVGTKGEKVTKISGLEKNQSLRELVLRSCLISYIEGLENALILEKLELYDNIVTSIDNVFHLTCLRILDLSFNSIRDMAPLSKCSSTLEELYIAQNKIRRIEGLEHLINLKILDLGANRIREMEGLANLKSLESLWLGKNKIEKISGVGHLPKLRQLDVQNNRLLSFGDNITDSRSIEELYLGSNNISTLNGIPSISRLKIIDLSKNPITSLFGIENCSEIKELWMSYCNVELQENGSVENSLMPLKSLEQLECLYLEHNPLQKSFKSPAEYREVIKSYLPTLQQLDADIY